MFTKSPVFCFFPLCLKTVRTLWWIYSGQALPRAVSRLPYLWGSKEPVKISKKMTSLLLPAFKYEDCETFAFHWPCIMDHKRQISALIIYERMSILLLEEGCSS